MLSTQQNQTPSGAHMTRTKAYPIIHALFETSDVEGTTNFKFECLTQGIRRVIAGT